jgi:DNA ligase-1
MQHPRPLPVAPTASVLLLLLSLLRAPSATSAEQPALEPAATTTIAADPDASATERRRPALTLAEVYAPGARLDSYLVSEKYDGVRAYWDGTRLITRGGLVINAPAWFTADLPPVPLDGELWLGRRRFAEVSGAVRRLEPEPDTWRRMRYMLFDLPGAEGGFEMRLRMLRRLVAALDRQHVVLVEHAVIADQGALAARLDAVVAAGGEGLMLHRRDAPYRPGRSDALFKLKPYLEGEARVIRHLPGRGKYQGMLGSLLVELPNGKRFRIGSGFSDAERSAPPPVGSIVSFKYHGYTKNGLPRFASFLRVAETL